MITKKYIVSGKVQGVWFRASTKSVADRLGIKGYAKNLADGSVEVIATGTQESLEALHTFLQIGPELADVKSVVELETEAYRVDTFTTK